MRIQPLIRCNLVCEHEIDWRSFRCLDRFLRVLPRIGLTVTDQTQDISLEQTTCGPVYGGAMNSDAMRGRIVCQLGVRADDAAGMRDAKWRGESANTGRS